MKYRTDLALESKELYEEENEKINEDDGIVMNKTDYGKGVRAIRIDITNEKGEMILEKPSGTYITIEAEGILAEEPDVKEYAVSAVTAELAKLVPFHNKLKVLVAGLGNSSVTPDALGPAAVMKVKPTRHLFEMFAAEEDEEMSNVSCIIPGVMGNTGLESAEMIKKAIELVGPEVVIVVDSLAARNIERLSSTIQLADTGISPGAGMGNNRTGITKELTGVKVIAIGVPTVIDVATVIRDSLIDNIEEIDLIEKYMNGFKMDSIVTSTDIDMIIKEFSDIISNGINKVLHPGIYS